MRFVDTNVLIYAVSRRPEDAEKRRRAAELLEEDDLAFSAQVVGEFYYQATRATRQERLTHAEALDFVEKLQERDIHPITYDLFSAAVVLSDRYQRNIGMPSFSRRRASTTAKRWYSEDMSACRTYAGLGTSTSEL